MDEKKQKGTMDRRKFLKTGVGALGAGVAVASGLSFPRRANAAKNTIKIGCQGISSGALGLNGIFMSEGAQLAVEQINARGGILGRKIELGLRDSEGKPAIAVKNARYFVNTWGANFLIGVDSSGIALALGEIMSDLNRILIVTHGSTNKYNEDLVYKRGIKHCFRASIPLYLDGIGGSLVAKDFNLKRWAFIIPDYEYGHTGIKLFKSTLKSLQPDVEFVADTHAKFGTVDFSSHIMKVMAAKPDGIMTLEWGGELVGLIKQSKLYGVFDKTKMFMSPMAGAMDTLMGLGKDYPSGIWGTSRYWFRYPDSPTNRDFVSAYRKKWKKFPSHNSECAYTSVYMIKQAVEKAKTVDTDAVIKAMEGLEFIRPGGLCYIRKEDHQAVYTVPWGQVTHVPEYPMPILTNLKVFPTDKLYRKPPFKPVT